MTWNDDIALDEDFIKMPADSRPNTLGRSFAGSRAPALARAMLRFSWDSAMCDACGIASRRRPKTTFSIERCAQAVGWVYEEMLWR